MADKKYLIDNAELMSEWNWDKNTDLDPHTITEGSHKKAWWKCSKGHEWEEQIQLRTSGFKCPYCIGKRAIKGETDFATVHPELLKEWDFSKNTLQPDEILPSIAKKVWWKCDKGHEWQASLNHRHRGTGCPICSKESSTSFPETAITYYLGKCIKVENRKKVYGKEIDIFIPSLNVGIEYDGMYYHSGKKVRERDDNKTNFLKGKGIFLIRVKESTFFQYDIVNNIIYTPIDPKYNYLLNVITTILGILQKKYNLILKVNVDITRDRIKILENFKSLKRQNSIQQKNPTLTREWNYEKNNTLAPETFDVNSRHKVWWKCDKGHEWEASIYSRNVGNGCPYCSNQKVLIGFNDLSTTHPNIAKEWDFERNGSIKPTDVVSGSDIKVWWKCEKGHRWQVPVKNRTTGSNCPYCANKKVLKGYNDFETWCKNNNFEYLLDEFDVNKNHFSESDITSGSGKKVWWICPKGHSYCTFLTHRTKMKTNCPYCSNKKVLAGFNDLLTTNPTLAREWNFERNGDVYPTMFTENSTKKVWWKCNEGHEWQAMIGNRNKGRGCPICYQNKRKRKN